MVIQEMSPRVSLETGPVNEGLQRSLIITKQRYDRANPIQEAMAILSSIRHGSPKTRRAYQLIIRQSIRDCYRLSMPFNTVRDMRVEHFLKLVTWWKSKQLSLATIRNRLAVWRNYLLRAGHSLVLPSNLELQLVSTQKEALPVSESIIEVIDNRIVKQLIALQIQFGLTRMEAIYLSKASRVQYPNDLFIHKKYAHNSRDRLVPVITGKQKETLDQWEALLGHFYSLGEKLPLRILNYLYYGELGAAGYSAYTPFRQLYAVNRYAALLDQPDVAMEKIALEMGLRDTRDMKHWIAHHE